MKDFSGALPQWVKTFRELGSFVLVAVILWFSFTKIETSMNENNKTQIRVLAFLEQQSKVLDKLETRLTLLESRGK